MTNAVLVTISRQLRPQSFEVVGVCSTGVEGAGRLRKAGKPVAGVHAVEGPRVDDGEGNAQRPPE